MYQLSETREVVMGMEPMYSYLSNVVDNLWLKDVYLTFPI